MRAFYILFFGATIAASGSVLAACGGTADNAATPDSGGGGDAGATDEPEASAPAPFPAFQVDAPQVVNQGGPVMKTPKVTPVYFPGFDYATELTDMTAKLGATSYWGALKEYGVGPLTQGTPVTLTANDIQPQDIGDISDADIQAWLVSRFDGTHPEFGTDPDQNTVYTLYYPPQTNIFLSNGGGGGGTDGGTPSGAQSCQSFGGYHGDVTIGLKYIAYAVIPECATFGNLKGADVVTTTTSHELSEAATDPFPTDQPAYAQVDGNHLAWEFYLGGGEVGDMCAQFSSSFYKPDSLPYIVQRNWSNAQAKAGHDPCQPELPGEVYFNSAPVFPDQIPTRGGLMTKGIKIPVGQSKTLELDLYSPAATSGPWTVSAQVFSRNNTPPFTFAFDKTAGQNGDKLSVTITATTAITSKSQSATILIESQLGAQKTVWIGLAGN